MPVPTQLLNQYITSSYLVFDILVSIKIAFISIVITDVFSFPQNFYPTRQVKAYFGIFIPTIFRIEQKDSLFEGKLPDIKYFLQEYCTCNTPATKLEPPSYTCLKSSQMNKCRQTQTAKSVYHASCITSNYRSKRDVSEIDYTDEKPPMYPIIIEPEEEHVRKAVSLCSIQFSKCVT